MNKFTLNETSYHGAGAISAIPAPPAMAPERPALRLCCKRTRTTIAIDITISKTPIRISYHAIMIITFQLNVAFPMALKYINTTNIKNQVFF